MHSGANNQPPLINLNTKQLTWQWWTSYDLDRIFRWHWPIHGDPTEGSIWGAIHISYNWVEEFRTYYFQLRNCPPNQTCGGLEIHTSVQARANKNMSSVKIERDFFATIGLEIKYFWVIKQHIKTKIRLKSNKKIL